MSTRIARSAPGSPQPPPSFGSQLTTAKAAQLRRFALGLRGVGEALDAPAHTGGGDLPLERGIAVLDDQAALRGIETGEARATDDFARGEVVIAVVAPAVEVHRPNPRPLP
jgi:hypothetical protein